MAKIAPTETPTARATVAAFFSIQRERRSQSTARNAPVPAIQARMAAIQPTTANAHEDAATALQAMSAMPTPIRTFAVFCQISRRRSVFERTVSGFDSSTDERDCGKSVPPERIKSANAAIATMVVKTYGYALDPIRRRHENPRKIPEISRDKI